MNQRHEARARTMAAILAAARDEVARGGGVGLSMRAIARTVGVVSSAVYRYFPTREALLTAMIVESYGSLATTLDAADDPDTPDAARWRLLAEAFRGWAREHPHEFQLIYGTPIPDYQAPPETIPAAGSVAQPFLTVGGRRRVDAYAAVVPGEGLATQGEPSGVSAVVVEMAALVGLIGLELGGHLVGVAEPDALYEALVGRQVDTLGLSTR